MAKGRKRKRNGRAKAKGADPKLAASKESKETAQNKTKTETIVAHSQSPVSSSEHSFIHSFESLPHSENKTGRNRKKNPIVSEYLSQLRNSPIPNPTSVLNESNALMAGKKSESTTSSEFSSPNISPNKSCLKQTNEVPISGCTRGRRKRSSKVVYFEAYSSSEEDEFHEESQNQKIVSSHSQNKNKTLHEPVLNQEVNSSNTSNSESETEAVQLDVPSGSSSRKRRRKRKPFSKQNKRTMSSNTKTAVAAPGSQELTDESLSCDEVEIKELRICITRVDDLEEFRESLRKFKENLAKSLINVELFGSDSECDKASDSEGSEDEYQPPTSNSSKSESTELHLHNSFQEENTLGNQIDEVPADYPHTKRPIKCNYCSRFFSNLKMLEAHESLHNNKTKLSARSDPFDCQFCPRKFKKHAGLKKHIELRHSFSRPTTDQFGKTCKLLRRISVARKHIRPITKDDSKSFREPRSPIVETETQIGEEYYPNREPLYVSKDGAIELGPVKEEFNDDMLEVIVQSPQDSYLESTTKVEENEEINEHEIVRKTSYADPLSDEEQESCPMADMFIVPEELPPSPVPVTDGEASEGVIPFDMTNGVQCNISDMGSLLDLLDGPDPNASVPGYVRETLTLNYEPRNQGEKGAPFKCEFCPKILGSKIHMLAHRRESHSARIRKPYICLHPNCSQRFESSQSLQMHRNKAHSRKEDVAEAPILPILSLNLSLKEPETISFEQSQSTEVINTNVLSVEMAEQPEPEVIIPTSELPVLGEGQPEHFPPSGATTVAERNEDLLKGLKYICKVCGAKFKKVTTFVQHEWLHSEDATMKKRRRKISDLPTIASLIQSKRQNSLDRSDLPTAASLIASKRQNSIDRPPKGSRKLKLVEEGPLGQADEIEELSNSSLIEGKQKLQEDDLESSANITAIKAKAIPGFVPVPRPGPASIRRSRLLEPLATIPEAAGSPSPDSNIASNKQTSASNVSDDQSSADNQGGNQSGVSFRIVRDAEPAKVDSKICDICANVCYGTFGLENHMFQAHKLILCIACNLCSTSQSAHETHLLSAHRDHKHFCKVCVKLLHNDSHFSRHTEGEPHKLKVQLKEAESEAAESELNLDCESECLHRNFICDICSSGQHTIPKLELHVLQSHQQFLCTICLKLYGSRAGVDVHRRGHVGESKFDCHICMMPFKKKASLASHQKSRGHANRVRELSQSSVAETPVSLVVSAPLVTTEPPTLFVIPQPQLPPMEIHSQDSSLLSTVERESISIHELLRNPRTGDYQCCLCLDEFLEYDVFDDHMVIGHDVGMFKKISGRVRKIFRSLNQKPQIFKCTGCKKIFLDNSAFKRHWIRYHSITEHDLATDHPENSSDPVVSVAIAEADGQCGRQAHSRTVPLPQEFSQLSPNKNSVKPVAETQLAQMLDTTGASGNGALNRSAEPGSADNLPVSIVAPMRTVYACGKCDTLFTNQVELNIHSVDCAQRKKRKLSTEFPRPAHGKPTNPPQIVDLTEEDDDEAMIVSGGPAEPNPEFLVNSFGSRFDGRSTRRKESQPFVVYPEPLVIRSVFSLQQIQPSDSMFPVQDMSASGPTRFELDSETSINKE